MDETMREEGGKGGERKVEGRTGREGMGRRRVGRRKEEKDEVATLIFNRTSILLRYGDSSNLFW